MAILAPIKNKSMKNPHFHIENLIVLNEPEQLVKRDFWRNFNYSVREAKPNRPATTRGQPLLLADGGSYGNLRQGLGEIRQQILCILDSHR